MLNLPEQELEEQMLNQKIRIKLFEGFDYEQYNRKHKKLYEPLKSNQR